MELNSYKKIGSMASIDDEIKALEEFIVHHAAVLNDEGVWLFLATLGCWSVTQVLLQFFAFILTIYLFSKRTYQRYREDRSFNELFKIVELKIFENISDEDKRKARLYDLEKIKKEKLPIPYRTKIAAPFLFSWLFFTATVIYSIWFTK